MQKVKKTRKGNLLLNILREKCPSCGVGRVFEPGRPFRMPVMKHACEACGYRFDREPGYFIGAMYISYGLAVAEAFVTFLACHFFFPNLATIWIPVLIMLVIILCSVKNFRLSRIIYIHIFPW